MTRTEIAKWSDIVAELRQRLTVAMGRAQRAQHLLATDADRAERSLVDVVDELVRIDRMLETVPERVGETSPLPT